MHIKKVVVFSVLMLCAVFTADARTSSDWLAAQRTGIAGLVLLESEKIGMTELSHNLMVGYVDSDVELKNTGTGTVFGLGKMTELQAYRVGKLVVRALSQLPERTVDNLGIKYIIVGSYLKMDGDMIGGVPIVYSDMLLLSVIVNRKDSLYFQHSLLHELYHFMEIKFRTFEDPQWTGKFGTDYLNSYEGFLKHAPLGQGGPGFINKYARTYDYEDRAELFAYMMLDTKRVADYIRKNRDRILDKKAQYLVEKARKYLNVDLKFDTGHW